MFKLSASNLLKTLSPVAIAASIFVATEVPAQAVPRIYVPSSRPNSGYSRPRTRHRRVAPPSLNVTPLPGRHIPLPRSSRYYYRPSRHRDRSRYDYYGDRYDRRYRDRYYDRRHNIRYRDRYRDRPYRDSKRYRGTIIINPILR